MINLYKLLNLPDFEGDLSRIKEAVERCGRVAQTQSGEKASQFQKVYDLGVRHLLDPAKKQEYDAKLGQEIMAAATSHSGSESLEGLLPAGDPSEPFNMAAYLESSTLEEEPAVREMQLLHAFVQDGQPIADATVEPEVQSNHTDNSAKPVAAAVPLQAAPRVPGNRPPKSLARSIRRKRDRSFFMVVGGLLLGTAIALGLVIMFIQMRDGQGDGTASGSSATPLASNDLDAANAATGNPGGRNAGGQLGGARQPLSDNPRRGSGLPQVDLSGLENQPDVSERMPATEQGNASAGDKPVPPAGQNDQPSEPEPSLSTAEKSEWTQSMQSVLTALGQQDYDTAETRLAAVAADAKTEIQAEQLVAMEFVIQSAKQCQAALMRAIQGLGAGETITVQSMEVSFVEAGATHVIVRKDGRNQNHKLVDLPVGLLEGLLDLELERESMGARAQRAIFLRLHPRSSELVLPRVYRILAEVEAAEAMPEATFEFLSNDFQLP